MINEDVTPVDEGTALTFTAGSDTPGATFAWTVLRDGGLVATGDGPSLDLVAEDDGVYRVELTATVAGVTGAAAVEEFTALNVAPTIALSGADTAAVGAPYPLTLGPVTDPGTDNAFSFDIHWGDGTTDTVATLGTLEHTYTAPGAVTIHRRRHRRGRDVPRSGHARPLRGRRRPCPGPDL